MKANARNTPTDRRCPACKGAGEGIHNDTNPHGFGPDPQCYYPVTCDDCGGAGWIPFREPDPILYLAERRRRRNMSDRAAFLYGAMLQRVVSPVPLPRDRHRHDPLCPVATVYDAMGSRP